MNKFNLLRLKRYNCIAEIVSTQGGSPVLQINLPRFDGMAQQQLGFGAPPHLFETDRFSAVTSHVNDADRQRFFETDPSCEIAAEVLDALARHGQKLAAAAGNNKLSGDGKHEIAVEATTTALLTIGTQYAALMGIGERLRREHSELYAVPAADAAATAVDIETRAIFRALTDAEAVAVLTQDERPEHAHVVLSLKRAIFPLRHDLAKFLEDAWTQHVCNAKPEQAATLKIAEDNHEWANRLTKYIAGIVANPSLSGTHGTIDRFGAYKALRPTGGADVLEFTDADVRMYERQVTQAAA